VVSNDDARDNLEEGARKANSNLQHLIAAIGGVLTASGDLLVRVQGILSGTRPAAGGNGCDEGGTPKRTDHGER